MIRLLFASLITFFLFASSYAQTGTLKGKVTDKKTKEALIAASVYIPSEPTKGVFVDMNGSYEITGLKPGTYTVVCEMISLGKDSQKVVIRAGQTTVQNFSLGGEGTGIDIDQFVVVEKIADDGANENIALIERQNQGSVQEIMSNEEMTKRGDARLNDVVKRSVGTTIVGGKYIYVRGLSDRYSKTMLNGNEIPGLDPDRNAVQIDLFPTSIVKQLKIIKSFTPNLPGDFTGGLVDIVTKDFPDTFNFSYQSSLNYNTRSSFRNDFLTSATHSKLDWLGMDDGTRDIPKEANVKEIPPLFKDNEQLMNITRSFSKDMQPVKKKTFMNHSHSVTVGNTKKLFGKKIGFLAGLTYQRRLWQYDQDAQTGTYQLTGDVVDKNQLDPNRTLKDVKSIESTLIGGLLSATLMLNDSNRIGINFMRNQNGIASAAIQNGEIPSDAVGLYYVANSLTFKQRYIQATQLRGEHQLGKLNFTWLSTYTNSGQSEPDLRYFNYDYTINETNGDTIYDIQPSIYTEPMRFYRWMNETNIDVKLHWTLNVGQEDEDGNVNKIRWGLSNLYKDRTFKSRRYGYSTDAAFRGSITEYLNDSNMTVEGLPNNSIYVFDETEKRNSYTANQMVSSGYLMGDYTLFRQLRVIAGVRAENAVINVASDDTTLEKGELRNLDFLPSLNLTYSFKNKKATEKPRKTKLRGAYTRTLARPVFRELAPFATYDFATGWVKVGNPELQRTLIDNLDLRVEQYFNAGEIIAVSAFYKRFTNPIELVFNPIAQNAEVTWRNIPEATVYGAEFEIRKKLGFIDTALTNFNIGANYTYVHSEVGIDSIELVAIRANDPTHPDTRQMFGQSPYIVNAFMGYSNDSIGLDINLSYNISGPRLAVVVVGATPNVFSQPRGQMDLSITKKLGKRFTLRLRARNLLDPLYRMSYTYKDKEYMFNSYRRGRLFSIGIRYNIG